MKEEAKGYWVMKNASYADLIKAKRSLQERKEQAIRNMSAEDWVVAKENFDRAAAEGRLPPKIKSRRSFKDCGFGI
ncbi:hypothetical protein P5704_024635 (plasmid) [Pseudomonas sp. FeN3W]|nr:hypothetical protein P5704_024635 [Pseudomonas sp. FeN3W]